jgi:hypothetical protein
MIFTFVGPHRFLAFVGAVGCIVLAVVLGQHLPT